MIFSIIYFILAALGIGILIFIHELGHYWVARKQGMKVEAFSIGFGKPLLAWEKDGVKWQIGWIPVGGYVRISGMEKKGGLEPYQIADGFYGKGPWSRIKVALAGPLVNLGFAGLAFCLIWALGGREKPFSQYTHLIGWVEPKSDLYQEGVRPGDEITSYRGEPFQGFMQLQTSAFLDKGAQVLEGYELDYAAQTRQPFTYSLQAGENTKGKEKLRAIAAILSPASYLIYTTGTVMEDSPLKASGIQDGDRIVWVDGDVIFSRRQLSNLVNQPRALLSVEREGKIFFTRIPRLQIEDLRLQSAQKEEFHDWAYAKKIKGNISSLYFIPYEINHRGQVVNGFSYIDENAAEQKMFTQGLYSIEIPLEKGDIIRSVDGSRVSTGEDVLEALQTRRVQVVVQRGGSYEPLRWTEADGVFMKDVSFEGLQQLVNSIGTDSRLMQTNNLVLLAPVEPKP